MPTHLSPLISLPTGPLEIAKAQTTPTTSLLTSPTIPTITTIPMSLMPPGSPKTCPEMPPTAKKIPRRAPSVGRPALPNTRSRSFQFTKRLACLRVRADMASYKSSARWYAVVNCESICEPLELQLTINTERSILWHMSITYWMPTAKGRKLATILDALLPQPVTQAEWLDPRHVT